MEMGGRGRKKGGKGKGREGRRGEGEGGERDKCCPQPPKAGDATGLKLCAFGGILFKLYQTGGGNMASLVVDWNTCARRRSVIL